MLRTSVWLVVALPAIALAQGAFDPQRSGVSDGPPIPRIIDRLPVFFPPNPPPLGRGIARGSPPGRLPAPPELASYVCDFFYPALGTRLATKAMNDKLRAELEQYRRTKTALQTELRQELDRWRTAEPAARLEGLSAFARRQTPKIAELEKAAEQLRRNLITSDNNWSAVRQWHLSDKERRGFSPIEIAQVMRAYAYYENNLLPAQRRLLREIAIELMFAAETTAAATAAQPYMFFPPEPARVLFPDEMSNEVATKVAAYQTKKSELKKELYAAVQAADGASFTFLRGSPFKALAEKQAGRLAELDALAEEIRRGLADTPPPRVERSPLPVSLDSRVGTMIASYIGAQKEAAAKVDAILAAAKDLPLQATYRFEGDALKFVVVPTRGARVRGGNPGGGNPQAQVEAVRSQVSAVADDYGRRMADMMNERESIRAAIGEALNLTKPEDIDRVLFAGMKVAAQKESDTTFADYRIAVFQPGLSPEQRRLLFDHVVEKLDLPLPRGELQPTYRADTW